MRICFWTAIALGAAVGATAAREARAAGTADWASSPAYYGTIRFPDVNGDGKPDVCGRGVEGIWCGLSTGSGFAAPTLWAPAFSDAASWTEPQYYETIAFVDVNGDGKADVCARGGKGIYCALSTGSAFASPVLWSSNFSDADGWNASPSYYQTIRFVDVNGDGKADVCGRGGAGIFCALDVGGAFGPATLWDGTFTDAAAWGSDPMYYSTIQFPDLDGDGKADVCGRGGSGIYCALSTGGAFAATTLWNGVFSNAYGWDVGPQYYATIRFPDLNGDGKADLAGRWGSGLYATLGTGSTFGTATDWNSSFSDANGWTEPYYYSTIQFPDVDGDGKDDVCARGGAGIYCARSTGSGFGTATLWSGSFSNASGWEAPQYYETIQFPDLDGDGKRDVCARGINGIYCGLSTGAAFSTPTQWSSSFADPPAPPASLTATPVMCGVKLTWPAAPGATSYDVYVGTYGSLAPTPWTGIEGTTWTNSNMNGGIEMSYAVAAVGQGVGPYSIVASAYPDIPQPTDLTAMVVGGAVDLSWVPVPGAFATFVLRSDGTEWEVTSGSMSSYTDTTATYGTTYEYQVQQRGTCLGWSALTSVNVTVKNPQEPEPANLAIPEGLFVCTPDGENCAFEPDAYEPFLLAWYTCNVGGTAAGSFTDVVAVDGEYATQVARSSLGAGQCVLGTASFPEGLGEGEYDLEVVTDDYDTVAETTTSDNEASFGLLIDD